MQVDLRVGCRPRFLAAACNCDAPGCKRPALRPSRLTEKYDSRGAGTGKIKRIQAVEAAAEEGQELAGKHAAEYQRESPIHGRSILHVPPD